MKYVLFGLIVVLLAGCAPEVTLSDCNSYCEQKTACDEPEVIVKECPFEQGSKIKYFTLEPIQPRVDDLDCAGGFEELMNETDYQCSIKRAEPLREVGRDAEGKDKYEWRLDCACSYT